MAQAAGIDAWLVGERDGGLRMITIRLPATLQVGPTDTLTFTEPIGTIAELVDALDLRIPGFRDQLDDSVFNFAVNEEMLLYHARERKLADGDMVEIIPTISGG
jgi:molybdopterin converting factor small subunit